MSEVLRKRLISQEYVSQFSEDADNNSPGEDDIISSIIEVQEETGWVTWLLEQDKRATASLQVLQGAESGVYLSLLTVFILCEVLGGAVTLIPVNIAAIIAAPNLHTFSRYFNILLAQFYDEIVKILMKAIVGRKRPDSSETAHFPGVSNFSFPSGHSSSEAAHFPGVSNFSFPSGHSSRMGILGYLLITSQDNSAQYCVMVGLLALLVCSSRIMLGRHYLSDVVGGLIIGTVNGILYSGWFWVFDESFQGLFLKITYFTEGFAL